MKLLKQRWFVEGNSVYSEEVKTKSNQDFRLGKDFTYHEAVAFNVGEKIAKHIVELHNASLV